MDLLLVAIVAIHLEQRENELFCHLDEVNNGRSLVGSISLLTGTTNDTHILKLQDELHEDEVYVYYISVYPRLMLSIV
jgi:hypothetical protein